MAKIKQPTKPYAKIEKGQLIGRVELPLGNGKYKTERNWDVTDEDDAHTWGVLKHLEWKKGGQPEVGDKEMTFEELADWYKEYVLIAPIYDKSGAKVKGLRSWKNQRLLADWLKKYFGHYKLNKITVDILDTYKTKRLTGEIASARRGFENGISITAINREFALMRAMFIRACSPSRKWMDYNPFSDKEAKLINKALERPAKKDTSRRTVARLLARSRKSENPLLHYLLLTLRYTGARPSEIFPFEARPGDGVVREPLTWARVLERDFKTVRIVEYKGAVRSERVVPTSTQLERGLRELWTKNPKAKPTDIIFPFSSCKRSYATLCRSARVEGFWLRHFRTFFNNELADKIDPVRRMALLGHTSIEMNKRYSEIDEQFIKNYRGMTETPIVSVAVN